MNTTVEEGVRLAGEVVSQSTSVPGIQLILAVPFTHIVSVGETVKGSRVQLSAQNCASEPEGAYTGEVSAAMLSGAGAGWTIIAHSERRKYFCETDELFVKKIRLALDNGLKVIFCVGENLDDRNDGKHFDVVRAQIENVIFKFTPAELGNIVIAYEPVWAIGTGKTATAGQAQEVHAFIRGLISDKYGSDVSENVSILYGGSCKPSNAGELFACPDIDGGLIGGASLKAEDFIAIAKKLF